MTPFTTQEEKLKEEFISHPDLAGFHGYCNPTFANKIADWWMSKLHAHDQRLINHLLGQWPEEKIVNDIISKKVHTDPLKTVETEITGTGIKSHLYEFGFNSALQQTRKLLEDLKQTL